MKTSFQVEYKVYCKQCHEWHMVEEVEFVDVEEDEQGRDRMIFVCKATQKEQSSNVYQA